jgi:hypothetical protein
MTTTKEEIGNVIKTLSKKFDDELFSKTESELEDYWYFIWEPHKNIEYNLYKFHGLLKLYGNLCRRWEEHHNGNCCVVERVRDKYLMPKIRDFIARMREWGTGYEPGGE